MEINKLHDDVYEVQNFLTEQELLDVYSIIQNTPEEAWFDGTAKEQDGATHFWFGKN